MDPEVRGRLHAAEVDRNKGTQGTRIAMGRFYPLVSSGSTGETPRTTRRRAAKRLYDCCWLRLRLRNGTRSQQADVANAPDATSSWNAVVSPQRDDQPS